MNDNRAEIEALVRQVVTRTLGAAAEPRRALIDEATLRETPVGTTLVIAGNAIITPLARSSRSTS